MYGEYDTSPETVLQAAVVGAVAYSGLCYEFGFTYSSALGNPAQAFRTLLKDASAGNWSSYWASNGTVFQTKLDEMMAQYK